MKGGVPFISWKCRCGAHGNVEAAKPTSKYRLHRGKMTRAGLKVRPGHGFVEYVFYDQLQTEGDRS